MKTTLNTSTTISLVPAGDLSSGTITLQLASLGSVLPNGNLINQANRAFADAGSLAGSGTLSLNLYSFGGALDLLGQTFALSKIRLIHIRNTSTVVDSILSIGTDGTAAAFNSINGSDTVPIANVGPGGELVLFNPSLAGWAVANTTNHLLKLTNLNAAAALTYELIIAGS